VAAEAAVGVAADAAAAGVAAAAADVGDIAVGAKRRDVTEDVRKEFGESLIAKKPPSSAAHASLGLG
jgi:hypothetical protein